MTLVDTQFAREELAALSRELGDPRNDYAILAEGNTSALVAPDRFLLKASGASLTSAGSDSFVLVRTQAALELLEHPPASDAELAQALVDCLAVAGLLRPSVEAALHALALTIGDAQYVGHTHPSAVNAILCSTHADALVAGALFPDQIVVCGPHPLLVPYVDPGIPLAVEVRRRLLAHRERFGSAPKVIYLQNHGLFSLGRTAEEVLQVTAMATKAARILLGTLAVGGPRYLSESDADRIETREDEHYRRRMLANGAAALGDPESSSIMGHDGS